MWGYPGEWHAIAHWWVALPPATSSPPFSPLWRPGRDVICGCYAAKWRWHSLHPLLLQHYPLWSVTEDAALRLHHFQHEVWRLTVISPLPSFPPSVEVEPFVCDADNSIRLNASYTHTACDWPSSCKPTWTSLLGRGREKAHDNARYNIQHPLDLHLNRAFI